MTREEAKYKFLNTYQTDNFIEDVNEIFDELCDTYENRTCSNCKYSQFGPIGEPCRPQHYRCRLLYEIDVDEDFFCSKWESKDD